MEVITPHVEWPKKEDSSGIISEEPSSIEPESEDEPPALPKRRPSQMLSQSVRASTPKEDITEHSETDITEDKSEKTQEEVDLLLSLKAKPQISQSEGSCSGYIPATRAQSEKLHDLEEDSGSDERCYSARKRGPDRRLLNFQEFDMKALLDVRQELTSPRTITPSVNEQVVLSTRAGSHGSIGSTDVRLQVLIQHTESTVTVYCDLKDKVSVIFSIILKHLDLSETVGEDFGLFHPAQKNRIPVYDTVKSLHLNNDDLLIFKHILGLWMPKKKKPKFRDSYKLFMPRIPKLDSSTSIDSQLKNSSAIPVPIHYEDSLTSESVDMNILTRFTSCLEAKGGNDFDNHSKCKILIPCYS